jgi:hypothetical protein
VEGVAFELLGHCFELGGELFLQCGACGCGRRCVGSCSPGLVGSAIRRGRSEGA